MVCAAATSSEFSRLSVRAYDDAVSFYHEQMGMTAKAGTGGENDNLTLLTWSKAEGAKAAGAFRAAGLKVGEIENLDGLILPGERELEGV